VSIVKRPLKALFIAAGVLALTVLAACAFYQPIFQTVVSVALTPSGDFEEYTPPPAPDYAMATSWVALPETEDAADRSPAGLDLDQQSMAQADVFYIHPTTYVSRKGWNAPPDDQASNDEIEAWVLPAQAAAFNGCCRVYVPRYRQATIASFFDAQGNGDQALDLAYSDVARAFENFLATRNEGRPFIIAGHSQGARHARRLLDEVLTPRIIEERLIAIYTVGQAMVPSDKVPTCEGANQTGCQISWNTQTESASRSIGTSGSICVNPITWTADEVAAPATANLGSVDFGAKAQVEDGVVGAQCRDGALIVSNVESRNFDYMPFGRGNYHRYDYSLYYMNIRENAAARVRAFLDE
tara:strand:+ start:4342 stop:5406 length:1065 start_codon:yes stop_codon:yes gene_type:complete